MMVQKMWFQEGLTNPQAQAHTLDESASANTSEECTRSVDMHFGSQPNREMGSAGHDTLPACLHEGSPYNCLTLTIVGHTCDLEWWHSLPLRVITWQHSRSMGRVPQIRLNMLTDKMFILKGNWRVKSSAIGCLLGATVSACSFRLVSLLLFHRTISAAAPSFKQWIQPTISSDNYTY